MASESLTNTNISETYVGVLHAKGEAIPATGLQYVYDGFGNQSALKIGRSSIDVDGSLGTSLVDAVVDSLYPVGAVIFSADNTDPGDRFTGSTWEQIAEGRFLAGVGTGNDGTDSYAVPAGNDSTGEYNHTLTVDEIPAHTHDIPRPLYSNRDGDRRSGVSGIYGDQQLSDSGSTGGGGSHNNIPPAFGLYVWKRTA